MKIYFLGTGTSQGIPVIGSDNAVCLSGDSRDKRLRVSIWVHDEAQSIVIDCGPDFRQQMLMSKCQKIDGILFTHEHSDHTAGLDDIRPFNFKQGKISIFGHARVLENLKKRFEYIFEMSTNSTQFNAIQCNATPCHPMPRRTTKSCQATPNHATPRYATLH
jgi:phosphoribosyl 1,2-cyclic phosphate phosphodiesterase